MIRGFRNALVFFLVCLFLLAAQGSVQAVPPLPSSLYGTVKLNAAIVPDGTLVQALINNQVVATSQTQSYQGDSVYTLDIPGDDTGTTVVEGGREGDTIQFKIGGILANETGVWHSATNIKLNLTVTSTSTPLPPAPTATQQPTRTRVIATPTLFPPTITTAPPTLTASLSTPVVLNTAQATTTAPVMITLPAETKTSPPGTATNMPLRSKAPEGKSPQPPQSETNAPQSAPSGEVNLWIAIPAAILLLLCLVFAIFYFRKNK